MLLNSLTENDAHLPVPAVNDVLRHCDTKIAVRILIESNKGFQHIDLTHCIDDVENLDYQVCAEETIPQPFTNVK